MTRGDLFVTLKNGPLSSVLPVHVTSISRVLPFASHGLLKEPSPVEPFGQSCGGSAAVALGVGALEAAGGGVDAAGAALADGVVFASSVLEHARMVKHAMAVSPF